MGQVAQLGYLDKAEITDIDPMSTRQYALDAIRAPMTDNCSDSDGERLAISVTGLWLVRSGRPRQV